MEADHTTTNGTHELTPDATTSSSLDPQEPAGSNGVKADDSTEAGALAYIHDTPTSNEPAPPTTLSSTHPASSNNESSVPTHTSSSTTTTTTTSPADEQIVEAMREIIKSSDVGEITLRVLMALLEKKFGQELASRKGFVKEKIGVLLAEQSGEGEGEGEVAEEEGEEEAEEDGEAEKVKDQDKGKDKEKEAPKLSKAEMEVQKLLMEQIKFGAGPTTRGRAQGRTPKPMKPKAKKRKSTDNEENQEGEEEEEPKKKKKKGPSRANRPKDLSPALAEFLGESTMSRPDVVKKLHEYIKAQSLQNPKNKKQILLDEKLQQVFKRKTTDYFHLNSILTKHLTDPGELL